ncbi:MAG: N-acetyltransferase [Propionibacteriales bacterium]|nr:N-acetyltransferase [Propionibacteriales bacterium]
MELELRDNTDESRYELVDGDTLAGIVEYKLDEGTISLTHTEVDSSYKGEGLGSRIASGVLDGVRARGLAMLPVCPFIRRYVQRHPEYADLVPADRRAEFGL